MHPTDDKFLPIEVNLQISDEDSFAGVVYTIIINDHALGGIMKTTGGKDAIVTLSLAKTVSMNHV
jgi:hypothetical protein